MVNMNGGNVFNIANTILIVNMIFANPEKVFWEET